MDTTLDPLPLGWPIDHATPQPTEPMEDLRGAVEHALAHPLSLLPLADLAGPGTRVTVVIAITGHEHDAANAAMAPALMRELEQAGVADADITILIPNALHHASTSVEKRHSLGREIAERYRIVDHDPTNQAELNDLGTFQGVPVQVSYYAAEADLLIAIDVVGPHYYAGFSGGNKTISIGCVGAATLNEARTVRFLDDLVIHPADTPDSISMMLEREVGRRAGLIFVLNAVVDLEGRVMAVSAGAPNAVHDVLVRFARGIYEVDVPRNDYDIIIAGNGHSKRQTLYHASSAAVALGLAPDHVLAQGGVIILPVFCGGDSRMDMREQQFYEALSRANDMDTVMQQLTQRGVRS
ncbi:MAG TPA: lactate racemase domain-containing protein, partial [Anaerolineae bacterium]